MFPDQPCQDLFCDNDWLTAYYPSLKTLQPYLVPVHLHNRIMNRIYSYYEGSQNQDGDRDIEKD